jgi:hypothetical protein
MIQIFNDLWQSTVFGRRSAIVNGHDFPGSELTA